MGTSKRFFACLLMTAVFAAPEGLYAGVADRDARVFLQRLPNSTLPSFGELLDNGGARAVPEVVSYDAQPGSGLYTMRFNAGAARTRPAPHDSEAHSGSRLREFAVFARCVVRSFYIVRFEANDDPDNPLGANVPGDSLCPQQPQAYLERATRFADSYFHL